MRFRILLAILIVFTLVGMIVIGVVVIRDREAVSSAQQTAHMILLTNTQVQWQFFDVTQPCHRCWTKTPTLNSAAATQTTSYVQTAMSVLATNTQVQAQLSEVTEPCRNRLRCWTKTLTPTPRYAQTAVMATHLADNTRAYATATALARFTSVR
jgi:hypothetical protein